MPLEAISQVSKKNQDSEFEKVLSVEYNKYDKISKKVNDMYSNYSDYKPSKVNSAAKMMTQSGIQMNTITDTSTSKLSEILMQGTNMGIIEGRKLLNEHPEISSDIKSTLNDFVTMQEDSIETLKKYL